MCKRDKIGTALDPQESTAPISPPAPQLREVGATLVFSKKNRGQLRLARALIRLCYEFFSAVVLRPHGH
jgi:hypothetical protein